jgi:hypothetical protein
MPRAGPLRSSRSTWLAAAAGLGVFAWGILSLTRGPPGVIATAVGAFIAASGLWSRVLAIEVRDDRLLVRRAFGRPFAAVWSGLTAIDVPASPLGGWRFRADGSRCTLMPSDILGNEDALAVSIERAGLRFAGRSWTKAP